MPKGYSREELVRAARESARRHGVPEDLFIRQIQWESGFNPTAKSKAGATGIAQIMPRYHPGVDPKEPVQALDYAARLMAGHHREFGDWGMALAAYNAGGPAVRRAGGVPNIPETQRYVAGIMSQKVAAGALSPRQAMPETKAQEERRRGVRPTAEVLRERIDIQHPSPEGIRFSFQPYQPEVRPPKPQREVVAGIDHPSPEGIYHSFRAYEPQATPGSVGREPGRPTARGTALPPALDRLRGLLAGLPGYRALEQMVPPPVSKGGKIDWDAWGKQLEQQGGVPPFMTGTILPGGVGSRAVSAFRQGLGRRLSEGADFSSHLVELPEGRFVVKVPVRRGVTEKAEKAADVLQPFTPRAQKVGDLLVQEYVEPVAQYARGKLGGLAEFYQNLMQSRGLPGRPDIDPSNIVMGELRGRTRPWLVDPVPWGEPR